MKIALFLVIGIASGYLSGLIGIGGGTIIIPALIFFFGMSQIDAQGTTLAVLIPPVGILAAMVYYKNGHVNLMTALFICIGFILGAYFGANTAVNLPNLLLKRIFGAFLMIVALQMIFSR
jgi:uncharacterized membrane protein YfcA